MKAEDIINWPSDIKFKRIYDTSISEIDRLHKLAEKDLLDFSPKFLWICQAGWVNRPTDEKNQLRAYVTKYLGNKLAKKLKRPRVKIPWSRMKEEDIINWPSNVKLISPNKMDKKSLSGLYKLEIEDRLDFSSPFLARFKSIQFWERCRDALRSDIAEYLVDKLARKLNVPNIRVPWSRMKEGDIISWPPEVPFQPIYDMSVYNLKKLYKLANEDLLDFSPKFLRLGELQSPHHH
jgi:hypothetical protein